MFINNELKIEDLEVYSGDIETNRKMITDHVVQNRVQVQSRFN